MSHVEQLRKQNLSTYFGYADALIDAMQRGDYVDDMVPDSKVKNRGHILNGLGIPLSEGLSAARIQDVAALISILAYKQLEIPKGDSRIGKEFEFAATRYKGKGCFYFVMPEGATLDFDQLRRDVRSAKEMMRRTDPPAPNPLPRSVQASTYWIGPFDPQDMRFNQEMTGRLLAFHGMEIVKSVPVVTEDGKGYVAAKMADMVTLLQKEQLNGLTTRSS